MPSELVREVLTRHAHEPDDVTVEFRDGWADSDGSSCFYTFNLGYSFDQRVSIKRYAEGTDWSWLVDTYYGINCYDLETGSWRDDCDLPAMVDGVGDAAFRVHWTGSQGEAFNDTAVLAGDVIFKLDVAPGDQGLVDDLAREIVAGLDP